MHSHRAAREEKVEEQPRNGNAATTRQRLRQEVTVKCLNSFVHAAAKARFLLKWKRENTYLDRHHLILMTPRIL